jgi:hypothetical protein
LRRQLVYILVIKGRSSSEIYPKRRILRISQGADCIPVSLYKLVNLSRRGLYIYCKGLRFKDRPRKRIALAQIASNQGRESSTHESIYGCK